MAKQTRKAKKKLIATTPKLKIAAIHSKETTSQKLIATKTALMLRQTFAHGSKMERNYRTDLRTSEGFLMGPLRWKLQWRTAG
jgi:hypothetical protein